MPQTGQSSWGHATGICVTGLFPWVLSWAQDMVLGLGLRFLLITKLNQALPRPRLPPPSRWVLWTDTIPQLEIPAAAQFSDIIIPTKDSARYVCLHSLAQTHVCMLLHA